jgi:Tol biopolymer transport system component
MAHPFDIAKLRLAGEPLPVAEHVGFASLAGGAAFSVSESGVLVYDEYRSGIFQNDQLTWFDRTGKRLGTADEPGIHYQPWLSSDEKEVAVDRLDTQTNATDVWLIHSARGISERLTLHPKNDWFPVWAPDGRRIVFASDREGVNNLYQKIVHSGSKDELLFQSANNKWPTDWSLDGRFLLFNEFDTKTGWDLWVLPLADGAKAIPFLRTEFNEWRGVMSPDGKWIAYASDESGKEEVYVQPFPASGANWQVSRGGGTIPKYRRDGKELYYLGADQKMMAVKVNAGATFQVGIPESLFDTRITNPFARYAVSRDGQRFLIPSPLGETTSSPATVVLNWTAELKK